MLLFFSLLSCALLLLLAVSDPVTSTGNQVGGVDNDWVNPWLNGVIFILGVKHPSLACQSQVADSTVLTDSTISTALAFTHNNSSQCQLITP
jgi:hypothetical protein